MTIKLIHGDCLEVMAGMEPDNVDLIVTSPPYNCRKNYPSGDEWSWPEYYQWMEAFIRECYRLLLLGGTLAINIPGVIRWQADHKFADTWSGYDPDYKTHRNGEKVIGKGRIESVGFKVFDMMRQVDTHVREPIIWVKGSEGNAICSDYRMGCDSDPYMRPAHEMILLGSKGRWFHRGGTGRRGRKAVPFADYTKDVWFVSPRSNREHPAVFPQEIPLRLIKLFTHAPNSCVLDPFMGSGTTMVACAKTGRNGVGIEINKGYYDIAVKRVREAEMQPRLM